MKFLSVLGGLILFSLHLSGQIEPLTRDSGIINVYSKVIQIFNASKTDRSDSIRITNTSDFHPGDAAMIMQMKGPLIPPAPEINGYVVQNTQFAGKYEILRIAEIKGDTVIFYENLSDSIEYTVFTTFDTSNFVQLIRVPVYRKLVAGSTGLTCKPWDKKDGTGGVLAFMVIDTLTLKGNIDVDTMGFKGANPGNEIYTGDCSISDTIGYSQLDYTSTATDSAGLKGEGIAELGISRSRGRGYIASNPGGGNGESSGGGGGSNYYAGGQGGYEGGPCPLPNIFQNLTAGGSGGQELSFAYQNPLLNPVFLGSGGGAGTQKNGLHATRGGNGGGIVILLAPNIKSNGYSIKANGQSVTDIATAGAGGGGGGGAVFIDVQNCIDNLSISINGGDGGNTDGSEKGGPGGGGGSGVLWYSGSSQPKIIQIGIPGQAGSCLSDDGDSHHATDAALSGSPKKPNLRLQMKGFLFNFLPFDDTICKHSSPPEIIGSQPRGGNGPGSYKYFWKISTDKINWAFLDTNQIAFRQKDFQPLNDTITCYYKRIVKSMGTFIYMDSSQVYTLNIFPPITGNQILTPEQTICLGNTPGHLYGDSLLGGGDGTYRIQWQQQSHTSPFNNVSTNGNSNNFSPSKLTDTTLYRRIIVSGGCTDISNSARVNVLPLIKGNSVGVDQNICYNNVPDTLRSMAPLSGGVPNSYRYIWQNKSGHSGWSEAPGGNKEDFLPPALTDTTYFRRIVISGQADQCKDTSNGVGIKVLPPVSNNKIDTSQTICAGTVPDPFTGFKPEGGDSTDYRLRWDYSMNNKDWIQIDSTIANKTGYTPGTLTDTTWYRRRVISGPENACWDISNILVVNVHPKITNNIISGGETICMGQKPLNTFSDSIPRGALGPGKYIYHWQESYDSLTWFEATKDTINHFFSPDTLNHDRYYRRIVLSGVCMNITSRALYEKVLQSIANNILLLDTIVCFNTSPLDLHINGTPTGGNGLYNYKWLSGSDSTNLEIISGATGSSYTPDSMKTLTYFRRIVSSGPCGDTTKALTIGIHQLPTGDLQGVSAVHCEGIPDTLLLTFTGQPPWKFKFEANADFYTSYKTDTVIRYVAGPVNDSNKIFNYGLLTVMDGNKCYATVMTGNSPVSKVYSFPSSASAGLNDTTCNNEITLKGTKPGYTQGLWQKVQSDNFVNINNATDPGSIVSDNHVNKDTIYHSVKLLWIVTNGKICIDTTSVNLLFKYPPQAKLIEFKDTSLNQQSVIIQRPVHHKDTTLYNQDFDTLYAWPLLVGYSGRWTTNETGVNINEPADPVTGITIPSSPENAKYDFTWWVSTAGCETDTATFTIYRRGLRPYSGFSPGTHKFNDYYWVEGIELEPQVKITILSSWNKLVYSYSGPGAEWGKDSEYGRGWDGKGNAGAYDKKDVPEGIYYYIIEIPQRKTFTGYIILRRSEK